MAPPRQCPKQRILDRHEKVDGCWIWTGAVHRDGYGVMGVGRGTQKRAHRVSYEQFVGPIPDGMLICHRCDTPLCVNPAHLFAGTPQDNTRDMCAKGRKGVVTDTAHPNTKVSHAQRAEIRALRARGLKLTEIGDRYGISFQIVSAICNRSGNYAAA